MQDKSDAPIHPGFYVKSKIINKGKMTIKKAAELIGVGRPALSNFLNGNASLSQPMAARLDKAFRLDKQELLDMQIKFDSYKNREKEQKLEVRVHMPSCLKITSTKIDTWADQIEARGQLPAILRRLIATTNIEYIDFPAFDLSQRPGWDGITIAAQSTPWVPLGITCWEFGCDKDPTQKATKDYKNRTQSVPLSDRRETTFIFVTPRNWDGKQRWVKKYKDKKEWKDVRAFDANDLEQWLETSIPGQYRFDEMLGIEHDGCQTLSAFWYQWSVASTPEMSRRIFDDAIKDHWETLYNWLAKPSKKPLIITAESKEEAIAFLSCIGHNNDYFINFYNRTIVLSDKKVAQKLLSVYSEVIPIVFNTAGEKALVDYHKKRHSIIVTNKNITGIDPDIKLELLSTTCFHDALADMGFDSAKIDNYCSQSAKSPTILRRILTSIPAIKTPLWATSDSHKKLMVPLLLVGAWHADNMADQEILKYLANKDNYYDLETDIAALASIDDAPLWTEGNYRGVVSKFECLYCISSYITKKDIENFLFVAEFILSENDPALELEKDKRWAAELFNKVREHSDAIRKNICETLIVFSIYGAEVFGKRLSFSIESAIGKLIEKLIKDKNETTWHSQNSYLSMYAEAAPDLFLSILEDELNKDKPAFDTFFLSENKAGMFSGCDRSNMLWALELLAWKPDRLARVSKILAKLCGYEIKDNWGNSPINSLIDIFLAWRPHTAANLERRTKVLELICKDYPNVGWKLSMDPLRLGSSSTSGTHRPLLRSDASGAGNTVTSEIWFEYITKCLNLILSWPTYSLSHLKNIVDCLTGFPDEERIKVNEIVRAWKKTNPKKGEVLELREYVRTRTMTRRARKKRDSSGYANGKYIFELLETDDIVDKYQWLFNTNWVEYSPEELSSQNMDHEKRRKILEGKRVSVLEKIYDSLGTDGLMRVINTGESGFTVGYLLVEHILNTDEVISFIVNCFNSDTTSDTRNHDNCVAGMLNSLSEKDLSSAVKTISKLIQNENTGNIDLTRLYLDAPFNSLTWDLVKLEDEGLWNEYWLKVFPGYADLSGNDLIVAINCLLDAKRPITAFNIIHFHPEHLESELLIKLLWSLASTENSPNTSHPIESWDIENALETLNNRNDFNRKELIELEFIFIEALVPASKYRFPNLANAVAQSPSFFMQLIDLYYKSEEPTKCTDETSDQNLYSRVYLTLHNINKMPGSGSDGNIEKQNLINWIKEVRNLAVESKRIKATDLMIGELLSKSTRDEDDMWPKQAIREAIEEIGSAEICRGMVRGLRNSIGAKFRERNNLREKERASKYKEYSESVIDSYPLVGKMLLDISQGFVEDICRHENSDRINARLR